MIVLDESGTFTQEHWEALVGLMQKRREVYLSRYTEPFRSAEKARLRYSDLLLIYGEDHPKTQAAYHAMFQAMVNCREDPPENPTNKLGDGRPGYENGRNDPAEVCKKIGRN